jgi:hypothetical protein
MIGQDNLLRSLDRLVENKSIPRFSIVIGERGSESEDVGVYTANKIGCQYVLLPDVKVDTIRDMIIQAYKQHQTMVYIIPHADDMSVNAKNALLKVTEEPPNKVYFVMCLEDLSNTLATIQSRGTVFRMDRCKPTDIEEYARSLYVNEKDIDETEIKLYGEICSTPGDVRMLTHYGANLFYEYVEHVADNLIEVSGSEMFSLFDKLAYKDEENKYDVRLFLKAFQAIYLERCRSTYKEGCTRNCACSTIKCTSSALSDLRIKGINKQMLIECWALEVRKIWKSQS